MASPDHISLDRARAAFVAAAVGDALGWPMEDRSNRIGGTARVKPAFRLVEWRRREGGGYAPNEQTIPAGTYSDDTQMLLILGRSRLRGENWVQHLVEAELPLWRLYERGGGGALKRSADAWSRGRAPWSEDEKADSVGRYFNAGGNGVAMRCLVHGAWGSGKTASFARIRADVDRDGLATHGHPRALVGARMFAWTIWWALGREGKLGYGELIDRVVAAEPEWGPPPDVPADWRAAQERHMPLWEQEWLQAVEETLRYLHIARDSLHQGALAVDQETLEDIGFFGPERGSGTITAAAAVFVATRYVSQPQQGLLAAAFTRNSDSDTLAAMAGGLLGALAGGDWLGSIPRGLQDAKYIEAMAEWVARADGPEPPTVEWEQRMRSKIYRKLEQALPGAVVSLPIFGDCEVANIEDHETRSESFIRSWALMSQIGQTLTIKRYDRGKDGQPRWRSLPGAHIPAQETSPRVDSDPRPRPKAGLVREVSDLKRARQFYEEVLGLEIQRASSGYVSFGWLSLEPAPPATSVGQGQLDLTDVDLDGSRQAIRVYVQAGALGRRREELRKAGVMVGPINEEAGRPRFRCADPDGYVIEFQGLNGTGSTTRTS